jgi:hypothetical protein
LEGDRIECRAWLLGIDVESDGSPITFGNPEFSVVGNRVGCFEPVEPGLEGLGERRHGYFF